MPDTPEERSLARNALGEAIRSAAMLRSETVHIQASLARYLMDSLTHIDTLTTTLRTPQELAAIRERNAKPFDTHFLTHAEKDRAALLAHLDALTAAARLVDEGWHVVEGDEGRDTVRLRYASDLPARLNTLREALEPHDA
jgi:hypothetical protein